MNQPAAQPVRAPINLALPPEMALRAGAYRLLANLLCNAPSADLLGQLAAADAQDDGTDDVGAALEALGLAASAIPAEQVADEYQALFIGVGRGELLPYGSWYLTGFLMEKPLGLLRDHLMQLGFERSDDVAEPEDHVAALCEVMSLLITDQASHETQQEFFERHMSPWFGRFFGDLQAAQGARFYRAVGLFGSAFTDLEITYFAMRL
ncbi:MAG: molecular chaperone TorD family protein [Burkholderiaceae bacterium]